MSPLPYGEYPNCLHTTLASVSFQRSLQIVPQDPLMHTSISPTV